MDVLKQIVQRSNVAFSALYEAHAQLCEEVMLREQIVISLAGDRVTPEQSAIFQSCNATRRQQLEHVRQLIAAQLITLKYRGES